MLPEEKKHFSSLLNALKKTYVLEFDINQSIYYKKEKIGLNNENSLNFTLIPNGNIGESGKFYKNLPDKTFINPTEILGKRFVIKESLFLYN